mmetsp:Transcript_17668/g.30926  ORF Transcript_17668/g.30926 Transcript_17668/m.30926 type:complete len:81 (+) Transcript_17668:105-347(+)
MFAPRHGDMVCIEVGRQARQLSAQKIKVPACISSRKFFSRHFVLVISSSRSFHDHPATQTESSFSIPITIHFKEGFGLLF